MTLDKLLGLGLLIRCTGKRIGWYGVRTVPGTQEAPKKRLHFLKKE